MASSPKIEVESSGIAEVVLNAIVEGIVKIGEQVINFSRPDGNVFSDRDIDAASECERKSIPTRRL